MTTKTLTITLPAHWASYVINGDSSGLTLEERGVADRAINRECGDKWSIVSCNCVPQFTWSYRLYDPESDCCGGEVLDYIAICR